MAYEQPLSVEVDGRYHSVFVSTDIENVKVAASHRNHVHAGEHPLQIFEVLKTAIPRKLKPNSQRGGGVGVLNCKLPDRLLRNNMHQPKAYLNLRFNSKSGGDSSVPRKPS